MSSTKDLFASALIRANASAAVTMAGEIDNPILLAHVIHAARMTDDGEIEYERHGMRFTGTAFVEELRRDEDFAPIFRSAGLAPQRDDPNLAPNLPPGERNPWNDGADWNLTRQMMWTKRDPAVAARLKASAIKKGNAR